MPGHYSINSRAVGELLTAAKYNADQALARDNMTPFGVDGYSATSTQMGLTTYPGTLGNESLATTLAGELERLRYSIGSMKFGIWYQAGWGVHDRNVTQTTVTNTTTPTVLYSATLQNFHGVDSGFELRTCLDVFQHSGSTQSMLLEVLFGGQPLYSNTLTFPDAAYFGAVIVRAYTLARNSTAFQFGAGEVLQYPNIFGFYANPRLIVDTTAQQMLQVRVTMNVASVSFACTHAHTQLWRQ